LPIVALGNGKQTLLSARQKLTATGSRFHIKANSRDGLGRKKMETRREQPDDSQRRDYTDAAAAASADLRQRYTVIAVMSSPSGLCRTYYTEKSINVADSNVSYVWREG
jgi:hypothetical protein